MAFKIPPTVQAGAGTITVQGTGTPGEAVQVVITNQNGMQVVNQTGHLDTHGQGLYTFSLPQGTYDVSVTAPSPGGTVYDYPGQVVT